jgi:2-oxoisovalerate dehydrogenase E1 component
MDRADIVHNNFLRRVAEQDLDFETSDLSLAQAGLTKEHLVSIFYSQALSRQLDRKSRRMQAQGQGFYTIGSSGHEGNAAIASAFRPDDMAFLHYRDAAFQIARAAQVPGQTPLWDMLLSFSTAMSDPISGGRHKVLGSKALAIPPQTSTIASHLPKAVGTAYSVGMAKRIKPEHQALPDDAVVLCSFGDASLNHASSQAAFNTTCWNAFQGIPLPLVFVCEDNGIGISVKTPVGWVEATMSNRPGLKYFKCNGLDIVDTYATAKKVAEWVRRTRKPAFLHMSCVRLYGHAGPDVQTSYLSTDHIENTEAHDPLLYSAKTLIESTGLSAVEVISIYNSIGDRVEAVAEQVIKLPRLQTAAQVMKSIVPPKRACEPVVPASKEQRHLTFGSADTQALDKPQHMAKMINFALTDLMLDHKEVVLAGEDVGRKGGVYGVTQHLQKRFGVSRVSDTLLDEQSILGLAIGMAHNGFVPIAEIQFLAYLHNAEDQLRGEAATLPFFSNGQFCNPMVIRVAGLGYQRGFGGHFHNDNSLAVLRDIPGIVIACPSNGRDAVLMLRESIRLAREEQRVVVFVEPIALYMTRDLHQPDDGLWTHRYPDPDVGSEPCMAFDTVGVYTDIGDNDTDLAIVSYANGFYLSVQAAKILREAHGIACRIIDIRWIAPLPETAIINATADCKQVLIVDECRSTGSQSEALMALFAEKTNHTPTRLAAKDSFIATGPAYGATMPSRDDIVNAALALVDMALVNTALVKTQVKA